MFEKTPLSAIDTELIPNSRLLLKFKDLKVLRPLLSTEHILSSVGLLWVFPEGGQHRGKQTLIVTHCTCIHELPVNTLEQISTCSIQLNMDESSWNDISKQKPRGAHHQPRTEPICTNAFFPPTRRALYFLGIYSITGTEDLLASTNDFLSFRINITHWISRYFADTEFSKNNKYLVPC